MNKNTLTMGALVATSGNHYGGVTVCDPKDDSFYCKLQRLTNEIHMLIFIIMLIALPVYFLYKNKNYFKRK